MTVKRLSETEFPAVFKQAWEQVPSRSEVPDPVVFAGAWTKLMAANIAVAYATFEGEIPRGILCGLIAPDLHTGKTQGIEYIWAGKNTSGMLSDFETDCRARGCERAPALRRFYRGRGFLPFTESFCKELS